jgi:hypothetical protein
MDRSLEMKRLRIDEKLKLQQIGDLFNISRERVRQIIGNTGNKKVSATPKNFKHIKNGTAKKGAQAELLVSRKLTKNGIRHELMPYTHPFDIKTESGLRLEVKVSSARNGVPNRSFNTCKRARGEYADFFLFVIRETNEIFVVPFGQVSTNEEVRFSWPVSKTRKSKYCQYLNRFDLLKG